MTLAKATPRANIKIREHMVDVSRSPGPEDPRVLPGSCSALAGVAMSKRATEITGSMINCAVLKNKYNRMMIMNASPPATAASRVLGRAAIGGDGRSIGNALLFHTV
tara:strand:+ start:339 stop:659 length:321 start_codon:yes stop_codon:yes gene_type:complete